MKTFIGKYLILFNILSNISTNQNNTRQKFDLSKLRRSVERILILHKLKAGLIGYRKLTLEFQKMGEKYGEAAFTATYYFPISPSVSDSYMFYLMGGWMGMKSFYATSTLIRANGG